MSSELTDINLIPVIAMFNDARRTTFEYTANQLIIIRRLAHGSRGWGW